jgi:N-acetylglucosamine-6-phosphate deacetylase
VLKLIVNAKGEDKCIIITDSLSAACLGEGVYRLGDQQVLVTENGARLKSGSLAGSTIMMDQAVKSMIDRVGIDCAKALKMATINPAKLLGVDSYLGRIAEGYDADINILDDKFNLEKTILKGTYI